MTNDYRCCSCKYLCTDPFISPCPNCIDGNHWVYHNSFEEDIKEQKRSKLRKWWDNLIKRIWRK
jgi:hypothetical protein